MYIFYLYPNDIPSFRYSCSHPYILSIMEGFLFNYLLMFINKDPVICELNHPTIIRPFISQPYIQSF